MMSTINGKDEATVAVARLAADFGVPEPTIAWGKKRKVGRFTPFNSVIHLGPRLWAPLEMVIAHEFAHYLEWRTRELGEKSRRWHGPRFAEILVKVAAALLGDASLYRWDLEYPSLRSYGRTGRIGAGPRPPTQGELAAVRLRATGLSYRAIEARLGRPGNGTWAMKACKRASLGQL